jgi:hypothetical protein
VPPTGGKLETTLPAVSVEIAGTLALTALTAPAAASVVVATAPGTTVSIALTASVALVRTVWAAIPAESATGFAAAATVCVVSDTC